MDDLDEWLQRAQVAMGIGNVEAGFYYCAGLLDWRTAKLNSALRNFNFARRDPEWGQQAIYNMIEICLDPDDDTTLSNEAFNDEDAEYHDSRTMALRTAYRLLQVHSISMSFPNTYIYVYDSRDLIQFFSSFISTKSIRYFH